MGVLRFKLEHDRDFLDSNKELATPLWTNIRDWNDNSLDFDFARSVAGMYRLSDQKASEIIEQVRENLSIYSKQ